MDYLRFFAGQLGPRLSIAAILEGHLEGCDADGIDAVGVIAGAARRFYGQGGMAGSPGKNSSLREGGYGTSLQKTSAGSGAGN